ncbi:phosphate acyltransferase PlsX [Candidatus Aminicenantes bacterium AH-873-B07]|jgi:glycerol-3-phosphate acyltransferase PlsX|nr:phosphate acyltransferase PlsX [Candidatus Aminicenantes bacterium AH-873-B07]
MKIALDAMGGDFAPKAAVEGAIQASEELNVEIYLVGVEELIKREFDRCKRKNAKITIVNAPEVIKMGESIFSFRKKKKSSIRIGAQLVKKGEADAFVSAGDTGAVMFISKTILGALKGVERPALAILIPTLKGLSLLIDVGANAICKPRHLKQFAFMGKAFMESIMGMKNPTIGLMSIGEEESKGNELIKEAYFELKNSPLNFIGNLEGKDIYKGIADVIVCDGFTGNVALKVTEGIIEVLFFMMRREIMQNFFSKIGYLLMKRALKKLKKKIDYTEYGGALLLGLNGICIVGHGRSNSYAIKNAIKMAKKFVKNKVQEKIKLELLNMDKYLLTDWRIIGEKS